MGDPRLGIDGRRVKVSVLNVSEETSIILNRLRSKGESDEDLIARILDYARSFMLVYGAVDED